MSTVSAVLAAAAGEIGYTRWADPQTGTRYGRWYAAHANSPYYGENGVPYCAMFVSWVLARAGVQAAGLPGAYCPTMLAAARSRGAALANVRNARPGDIVYFDWGKDGTADHVGIVERNLGTCLQTIEGNTSPGTSGSQSDGGGVYRRTRAWTHVAGIVRPAYAAASAAPSLLAPADVKRMQGQAETPVDGEIWGQHENNKALLWGISPDVLEWDEGSGSPLVRKMQAGLGVETDGILGPVTIAAYQEWLGVAADTVWGTDTTAATRAAIKEERFAQWN